MPLAIAIAGGHEGAMPSPAIRRPILLCLALALSACASPLKVMSFNVRYASSTGAEAQRWATRGPVMAELIRVADADVIGTQELLQVQGDELVRDVPAYRWFGRDRRGAHADEHMGILYRADRLALIEQGDFWLSDTPEQPGSISWGADLPRMATWAVFERKDRRHRRFLLLNTHFAHRPVDDVARRRSAQLIVERLPAIARGLPVVLTGDLNSTPDSDTHRILAAALTDVWDAAPRRSGASETFHDFSGTATKRIDYVFVSGFTPTAAAVDRHHRGDVYPSDHFPVTATLRFDDARSGGE